MQIRAEHNYGLPPCNFTSLPCAGEREVLRLKLAGNTSDLGEWGHEYLRHLVGELTDEFAERQEAGQATADLMHLVRQRSAAGGVSGPGLRL